jgi:hypothetical protein
MNECLLKAEKVRKQHHIQERGLSSLKQVNIHLQQSPVIPESLKKRKSERKM